MEGLILVLAGLVGFGLLFSLVALFPPLRRWAISNRRRSLLVILIALLTFMLAFFILSPTVASVERIFVCTIIESFDGTYMCGNAQALGSVDISRGRRNSPYQRKCQHALGYPNSDALEKAIQQELKIRLLVPAFLQKPCYSSNLSLCRFIDEERGAGEFVELLFLAAFIPGVVAGVGVWWWTRPYPIPKTGEET